MEGSKIRVSVVGGAGYAGAEVLRFLAHHPHVQISCVVSETYAGKPVSAALPGFRFLDLVFEKFDLNRVSENSEVVFLAQESGFAMRWASGLLEQGCKVIDLSADFRLKEPHAYREWYKLDHCAPELLKEAVYGLPEIRREKLKGARLIANPGCYPTATILALHPLVKAELIDIATVVVDAKSGVSGAGRGKHSLDFHFPEVNESVRAYAVGGTHRHTPEIEQVLGEDAKCELKITFTPHLIPMTRGILATCYARLKRPGGASGIHAVFRDEYQREPFVAVLPLGAQPATKATMGSNQCHLGISVDERAGYVIVTSAIDNLVKGAAGQAVQNMNIICGLPETTGLELEGIWP